MVRTRFAPSPTGSLHVGNARVAVLNWLFARRHAGAFILRIEDTDADRNVPGAEAGIAADLAWLGLAWDEGPACGEVPERGTYGPYRQSERAAAYRARAEQLRNALAVYPCFCSEAQLEADRAAALARGANPHYSGRCRTLAPAEAERREAAGDPHVLRFRVPEQRTVSVRDTARGEVQVASSEIGDFVVLRSDGAATYNFAVVVDDIDMAVTHVIRGGGHLSNTPRQVLLYEAIGAPPPVFAHVPTVLGPDRQKLSKRHGATSIAEYRQQGYHPDALVNYLSLLSWSSPSGDEVLTRERLVEEVSLERIGVADVVFDVAKLRHLSGRHIERMPRETLLDAVTPFVDRARFPLPAPLLAVAVLAVRSHLVTFADVNDQLAAFYARPRAAYQPTPDERPVLAEAERTLSGLERWEEGALAAALKRIGEASGARGRALYEPLRRALTGDAHGPPFAALLAVRGRDPVLAALRDSLTAVEA